MSVEPPRNAAGYESQKLRGKEIGRGRKPGRPRRAARTGLFIARGGYQFCQDGFRELLE
jgi:hypothetical protein